LVYGLIHGEEPFGSLDDEYFDGALVIINRLKQKISKRAVH